ncbi:cysteine--tRNA ligase [Candidatus Microgenomates bacterium]|nr:cysteine--tRNA ligase [Candidatus Microgenomates bacterium]
MVRLFNTKTRKVEEFVPLEGKKVGMYSCGPTVYSSPHVGNLRAYVFVDILRRTLETAGYEVTHVMNITDVGHLFEEGDQARIGEDKLEYEAEKEKVSAWDIAKKYIDEFFKNLDALNIRRPTVVPRATDHIQEQIQLIKTLEEKGYTYKIEDGIYFDTSKFPKYGDFAGGKEGIKAGARIEVVVGKRHPTDFALWKFSPRPGTSAMSSVPNGSGQTKRQMEWESPWGVGFPGWHIECSAMSLEYLGDAFEDGTFRGERSRTIDIHTGGIDHVPVHHTNEIAQSESATGKEFVRYWLHNEFVLVDGKKMSKSLGNVYTLQDVTARGFSPLALRYLFLTTHYRDKLNFTWESLKAAQNAYDRLVDFVRAEKFSREAGSRSVGQSIEKYREEFTSQMNNDLGTPAALSVVWKILKSNIPNQDKQELLFSFDEVLGLNLRAVSVPRVSRVPREIKELVEEREKLRKEGKWKEADKIRKEIEEMGYVIDDTEKGPIVKAKKTLSI